jgi:spore germination protein GerM
VRPGAAIRLVTVVILLAACGINADRAPREIGADQRRSLIEEQPENPPRPGTSAQIFLLAPTEQGRTTKLRAVGRDVSPTTTEVLTALLDGLTSEDQDGRLRTAIPSGTELRSATLVDARTLAVDLSAEFFGASGEVLTDAVAQIVFTVQGVDDEMTVLLSVEGVAQEWPTGSGSLVSRSLSVFDYPDWSPSSQPDYPSLPSRGAEPEPTD